MVFLASLGEGLRIFDVNDPGKPELRGTANLPWPQQVFAAATDVFARDDKIFVAAGRAGVQVFDVSRPEEPRVLGSIRTFDYAKRISLRGDRAFVLDRRQGLQVVDISDPANMRIVGGLPLPADVRSIAVEGDMLYAASGEDGLLVLPLPVEVKNPNILGSDRLTMEIPSPAMAGDYILQVHGLHGGREVPGFVTFTEP
jgi:hypothetical protein